MAEHASLTSASKAQGEQPLVVLQKAYEDMFTGRATQVQRQVVLADLARKANYFFADPSGLSDNQIREASVKRWQFARIARMVPNLDLTGLHKAVIEDQANPSLQDI